MEKQGQPGLLWNSFPRAKWGASGVRQACTALQKLEEDRDEKCQPEQGRNEEEKGRINTRVLPVIFLLGDRINILLS